MCLVMKTIEGRYVTPRVCFSNPLGLGNKMVHEGMVGDKICKYLNTKQDNEIKIKGLSFQGDQPLRETVKLV